MPKDPNQLAAAIVGAATGHATKSDKPRAQRKRKNPAAVALGRLGGRKGGKARAAALTREQRVAIAKSAAAARWGKVR